MTETEAIRDKLEALAGSHAALFAAVGVLLQQQYGNRKIIASLEEALENSKASLLQSSATDRQIAAFDDVALLVLSISGQQPA
ncbi:hypothetical protein [Sulfurimicrobium lacus]|uniref:hypothetical protein n=1 Tax=Sulfurimicrobium lacus TaxID=2715678 RepID=UPI001566AD35|nr:hypothetical protein [Sulfurimicrobium lacus]